MNFKINWRRRVPILKWLPQYSLSKLQSDVIAGVTVGLMVIPQGLAYASIAELPPQYGLYSSFMCGFVYCFLGSCKDITQGPTAIMALMVAKYGSNTDRISYAVALSFYCGIIWFLKGSLSLGIFVRILPLPVISGFTSSAAITIACGQIKNILGLSEIPREFAQGMEEVVKNFEELNSLDVLLGAICIVFLVFLHQMHTRTIGWPSENENSPPSCLERGIRKLIRLLSTARNVVIVFVSALIGFIFYDNGFTPFTLIGDVEEGIPNFKRPSLTARDGNVTISTVEMISEIGSGFIMVPMIGFVTNIAIAQAFARKNNYEVDATQELIALGVTNFVSSFFSGFPVTGSFSRSSVNAASGVATQLGGVFTSCVVLLSLKTLTQFFKFIPKATLASIIITSVLQMVDFQIVVKIWHTNRVDLLPLFATFFTCFYMLEVGIFCGVLMALIIVLYRRLVPLIKVEGDLMCHVRLHGGLTYMGIEHFISKVRETALFDNKPEALLFDCSTMFECDFTVTEGLVNLCYECRDRAVKFILYNVEEDVQKMLQNAGMPHEVFQPDLTEEFCGLLSS